MIAHFDARPARGRRLSLPDVALHGALELQCLAHEVCVSLSRGDELSLYRARRTAVVIVREAVALQRALNPTQKTAA